ncbi:MAG TPA: transglycosylase SLT domain-containing protein, partial [Polyangia bacterium]
LSQNAAEAPTEARRARFLLGLALANLGRWSEAAAAFIATWRRDDVLADHVAYQSARASLRAGDAEAALTWSARVDETTVPASEAALVGLDALASLGRHEALAEAAGRFLARHTGGPRRHEAHFAQGAALAALGRASEAARAFRQAWAIAPSEAFAKRVDDRLAALASENADSPAIDVRKSASEWLTRGTLLAERSQHEAAEAAFTSALAAPGVDAAVACRANFGIGNALFRLRQRARAQTSYLAAEKTCAEAKDEDYLARAVYQRGRCLVLTGDLAGAATLFDRLEARFPAHRLADDARVRAAEVAVDRGDEQLADQLLGTLPERHPGGDMAEEAQWRLAFRAYQRRDYATARRILQPFRGAGTPVEGAAEGGLDEAETKLPRVADRARYFEARSWEGEGNLAEAVKGFEAVVRAFPLSLYASWSLARLEEVAPETRRTLIASLRGSSVAAAPVLAVDGEAGAARAVELARMGLGSEAQREIARVLRGFGDREPDRAAALAARVAHALDRGGFWPISYGLAVGRLGRLLGQYPNATDKSRGVDPWRLAFPRAYADVVERESTRNGVPPSLQWALMRQESGFEARAESSANCLGLTMLKPSTAEQRLGRKLSREELFEPALNVAAGSKHLAALLRRYQGAVVPAIAAYNAGETVVARWLAERGTSAPDEFVESI